VEIAELGLDLPGNCLYEFATWTRDLAQSLEEASLALRASILALKTEVLRD
jgi:hypothetical protein